MGIRNSLLLVPAAVFAFTTAVFNTAALAAAAKSGQVTGAIFTTDVNSKYVNANIYPTATDVYLNGGPLPNAPCTAAGLPDGDYYFQVTDPSGKVLLSYDSVDTSGNASVNIDQRKVNVTGGLMKSYSGVRPVGVGKCNTTLPPNITVRLFPYFRTPNNGGEYKVWMTPVGDYACKTAAGADLSQSCDKGSYGFIPSKSKTDNFKVNDYDDDGIPDSVDQCPDDPTNLCGSGGPAGATVSFGPSNLNVIEGSSDLVVIEGSSDLVVTEGFSDILTVTRTGDTTQPLTVFFTLSGTATPPGGTADADFQLTGAVCTTQYDCYVTFAAGSDTATITIAAIADQVPDSGETVILTLTPDTTAYTVDSSSSTATVTIVEPQFG